MVGFREFRVDIRGTIDNDELESLHQLAKGSLARMALVTSWPTRVRSGVISP